MNFLRAVLFEEEPEEEAPEEEELVGGEEQDEEGIEAGHKEEGSSQAEPVAAIGEIQEVEEVRQERAHSAHRSCVFMHSVSFRRFGRIILDDECLSTASAAQGCQFHFRCLCVCRANRKVRPQQESRPRPMAKLGRMPARRK